MTVARFARTPTPQTLTSVSMPPRKQKLSLPPKNPKKTRQAPTYDTFEDAIDGGVEQEEKGERWRVGDKVRHLAPPVPG